MPNSSHLVLSRSSRLPLCCSFSIFSLFGNNYNTFNGGECVERAERVADAKSRFL